MILLDRCGNENLTIDSWDGKCFKPANDITNLTVTVYNKDTDRVSDKSAYKTKDGRLYIKCKRGYSRTQRLFLDDFK
ncbi:hypothetical protein SDC9_46804 [bioreactor metagenome]|uniref:Uncharacterized protein n=1 Tax=bioreactor metagenome TaxID=1076179 RepID=A0A644WAP2_9ZZZZ